MLRHLVEEQNEVDGKSHKQSQKTQVVKVSSQIILQTHTNTSNITFLYIFKHVKHLVLNTYSISTHQHFSLIDVQTG